MFTQNVGNGVWGLQVATLPFVQSKPSPPFNVCEGWAWLAAELCSVHCPLCSFHCPLCSVHCPLCSVHCPLSAVHCSLRLALFEGWGGNLLMSVQWACEQQDFATLLRITLLKTDFKQLCAAAGLLHGPVPTLPKGCKTQGSCQLAWEQSICNLTEGLASHLAVDRCVAFARSLERRRRPSTLRPPSRAFQHV